MAGPAGYVFCVYEQHKAVIGDVFATAHARERANRIEARLLEHTLELLQSTPGTGRVETQLLLHPKGQFENCSRAMVSKSIRASSWSGNCAVSFLP